MVGYLMMRSIVAKSMSGWRRLMPMAKCLAKFALSEVLRREIVRPEAILPEISLPLHTVCTQQAWA